MVYHLIAAFCAMSMFQIIFSARHPVRPFVQSGVDPVRLGANRNRCEKAAEWGPG